MTSLMYWITTPIAPNHWYQLNNNIWNKKISSKEFNDTAANLLANVKSFARRKLNCGEMNQEQTQLYVTSNTPSSNDIYM